MPGKKRPPAADPAPLRSKRAVRVAASADAPMCVWKVFEAHKVNARGRMSVWRAEVSRDGRVRTTWGLVGGAMQTTDIQTTEGKCKRDPGEQAEMETATHFRRRIDAGGYTEGPPPEVGGGGGGGGGCNRPEPEPEREPASSSYSGADKGLLPMLLKSYDKYHHRLRKHPEVFCQPKLDGVRAPMHPVSGTMLSRTRKPFGNPMGHIVAQMPRIAEMLAKIVPNPDAVFLDGELYAPPPHTFHEISGAVRRKSKPKLGSFSALSVDFYAYDLFDRSRPDMTFEDRHAILRELLMTNGSKMRFAHVHLVHTERMRPLADKLKAFHDKWVGLGFEGAVYRVPSGVYKEDGRSAEVLKHKAFFQEEFRVMGVVPKQGEESVAGAVQLMITSGEAKGEHFRAGLAMSREQRRDIMERRDELVGEWGTVTFFERTPDGVPRFPILRGFRGKRDKL